MTEKKEDKITEPRGRQWSKITIEKILLPILREKVISESDLLKGIQWKQSRLNSGYKNLRLAGFPIKRITLHNIGTAKGTRGLRRNINHRVVVYCVE